MVTPSPTPTKSAMTLSGDLPGARPWEDRTLSAQHRYDSYMAVVLARCEALRLAGTREGITPDEKIALALNPANIALVEELKQLTKETPQEFCQRMDGGTFNIETVDGHQAVVGTVSVNGQQLDTLLSEGSFNRTRADQIAYAEKLGYRLATREEHRAYVEGLLAKEDNNTINDAEKNALKTYRERHVRDTQGGLDVGGRRVGAGGVYYWYGIDDPFDGALFVRASAESK